MTTPNGVPIPVCETTAMKLVDEASWRDAAMKYTLQAAVPLRIHELSQWDTEDRARLLANIDTHELHADDAMFNGKYAAEGMRNIITALALLAFAAGGVTFHGLHFCTNHAHCLDPEGVAP